MKNQNGSSRVDTVLKMMLIAFISLLAFSSGVWFGKSLSDSDHKLKALESDFSSASHTAQMDSKREDGQEDPLAEDEVASISEKFVTDQRDELGDETKGDAKNENKKETRSVASTSASTSSEKDHGSEQLPETVSTTGKKTEHSTKTAKSETGKTAKPDLSAAHAAAERVAHNGEPSEAGKTATVATAENNTKATQASESHATTKPTHGALARTTEATKTTTKSSLPTSNKTTTVASAATANQADEEAAPTKATHTTRAPSSSGLPKTVGTAGEVEFTVQIAAFPTADLAKSRADELVKKGFPAFPVEATVNGRTWFRVSVGSFKTMKEAASYRVQLLKQAELNEAIVQRIQR